MRPANDESFRVESVKNTTFATARTTIDFEHTTTFLAIANVTYVRYGGRLLSPSIARLTIA